MNGNVNLSGLDLVPLPYESLFSVFHRFAWRNALSKFRLKHYLYDMDHYKGARSLINTRERDLEKFTFLTGWRITDCLDYRYKFLFENQLKIWVEKRLKYCPHCLAAAYHSTLHQLSVLPVCPIHGCELMTCCSSCGAHTPDYYAVLGLERAFMCDACKMPVSGELTTLAQHLDLREQLRLHQQGMQELVEWIEHIALNTVFANRMSYLHAYDLDDWRKWCDPKALFRAIAAYGSNVPLSCTASMYRNLTLVRWQLEMEPNKEWILAKHRRGTRAERSEKIMPVYMATLKGLQERIKNLHLGLIIQRNRDFDGDFAQDALIDLKEYPVEVLAYLLLRRALERGSDISLFADVKKAFVWDEPKLGLYRPESDGRVPRLAWRSVFLGIYAGFYHLIQKQRQSGKIDLGRLHIKGVQSLIIQFYGTASDSKFTGTVIFPTIESMPNLPLINRKKLQKPISYGEAIKNESSDWHQFPTLTHPKLV